MAVGQETLIAQQAVSMGKVICSGGTGLKTYPTIIKATLALVGLLALAGSGTISAAEPARSDQPPLRWAADAEGGAPYIFKDPENPEQNIGLRGRSGRGPGGGTRPENRLRPVPVRQPRAGTAAAGFRLGHERLRDHARPGPRRAVQPSVLRVHAAVGRPRRRDAIRLAGTVPRDRRRGRHAGRHGRRAAVGRTASPQEHLRRPG